MIPGSVIPIRGKFEGHEAFLNYIATDDIESFAMVTIRKDGTVGTANFKMTRANMAYASIILAELSRQSDF